MTTNFNMVGEFHRVFGHPITTEPQYNIFDTNDKLVKFRQALIDEENNEFKEGCEKKDLIEVADALTDMLYVIYGAGHAFGINLDKTFIEVQKSNMSKLCKTEEEAKTTVEWYINNDTRYKNPQYKQSGDYFIVYDETTSKILKSINFKLPNLKDVL